MIKQETQIETIGKDKVRPVPYPDYPLHGGDRKAASRSTGLSENSFIDFSASINPLGPPERVQQTLGTLSPSLAEYPDPDSSELKDTLSRALGVDQGCLMINNGSTELIYMLPTLFEKGEPVVLVQPSFSEYARALELASVPATEITLESSKRFLIEIETFLFQLHAIKNLGGVFIGHPNSPTGRLWNKSDLISLLNFCEKRKAYLIIDETFLEFAEPGSSIVDDLDHSRFLILIRSMTKFYALPGVRLGYGIMSSEIVDKLEARRPPWSVNAVAQTLGNVALSDRIYPQQVRDYIRRQKNNLYQNLKSIGSLEVFPSDTNFILFRLKGENENRAHQLYHYLLRNHILIRNCGNFSGLDSSFFRVAVKKDTENETLITHLRKYFNKHTG